MPIYWLWQDFENCQSQGDLFFVHLSACFYFNKKQKSALWCGDHIQSCESTSFALHHLVGELLTVTRFSFDKILLGRHQVLLYVPRYLLSSSTPQHLCKGRSASYYICAYGCRHLTRDTWYTMTSLRVTSLCKMERMRRVFPVYRFTSLRRDNEYPRGTIPSVPCVTQYHNGRQAFASSTESTPSRHRWPTRSCVDSHYQLPCS